MAQSRLSTTQLRSANCGSHFRRLCPVTTQISDRNIKPVMSTRQLRKLFGTGPSIVKVDDSSDSDVPVSHKDKLNPFAGLDVSSGSDAEHETDTSPLTTPTSKRNTTKKKVKKNKKRSKKPAQKIELEDIDQIVEEVNQILGEPDTLKLPERIPDVEQFETIFAVYKKNLNSKEELDRRFGPDDPEDGIQRIKKNRPKEFLSDHITPIEGFVKGNGISMSKSHVLQGIQYYTYDHSREYQKQQRDFLDQNIFHLRRAILEMQNFNTAEAEIEKISRLFEMDEYDLAIKALEYLIARLQCAADPTFSISNRKCRLEYKVVENRPFHIAVLQYSHVMSNQACNRTALELAKVLLNLDRSDPLAVQMIIDVYAIGAREYEWLVRAVDWYEREKEGKYLYNLQFSKALAMFHIAVKNKDSLDAADAQLKQALMLCPFMFDSIVRYGGARPTGSVQKLLEHDFFKIGNISIVKKEPLHELTKLYAAFLVTWWKQKPVYEWLIRNAEEILPLLQNSAFYQECAEHMKVMRLRNFRKWPAEVYRHLSVLKPLSNYIVDGAVPQGPFFIQMYRFNPLRDPNGINRYRYKEFPEVPSSRSPL